LAAQDGELVAQHQDLQVLGTVAAGQQDKQLDGAASEPGQGMAKASPYRTMVERTGSSEATYDLAHPTPHTDKPWPESDGAASRDRQRLGSPARY
jgi:hypothetical protein